MSADDVTAERITELRVLANHLCASGQLVGACLRDILDALEASRAEVAALRRQAEERRVEVPEPTDEELAAIVYDVGGDSQNDFERALVLNGVYWARDHLSNSAPSADVVTVKGDLPEGDKPTPEFMENYVDGFDPGERSAALFGWREGRRDLRAKFHALRSGEAGKEGANA